ncbi:hypothetical protein PE066_15250 [Ramlibacter tataouinensis]|uniref:hypothetical protein n=1 Tax=Ramlibacter tataouinensis TaxID=94132 RepID=UPI0022F3C158|nr:hypothetical protein [Ramlibacter tataouinensis]WBY00809.1 hypothetical protein PE066_15250 [Ramlibacter tataouinensis]
MSLELPILRIGLAGFSLQQQEELARLLERASPGGIAWEFSRLGEADALWIHGGRTQILAEGTVRVGSAVPGGRSVHIHLPDVDRPVAFALPVPRNLDAPLSFDPQQPATVRALLGRLENGLRPTIAQFCLASQVLEQESALGSGVYHVNAASGLLVAVVDLRGDVGVLPSATPLELENAMWTPHLRADAMPAHFSRASLSQLMWQYALRTRRDVLPRRYRSDLLYFRRPPRLSQRTLSDAHLLLLRELACAPGRFAELQQRTGLGEARLAQDLAALYLVGAITSNPKRASPAAPRRPEAADSMHSGRSIAPSGLGQESDPQPLRPMTDLTAPAPLPLE